MTADIETLAAAADKFTWGSPSFVQAVIDSRRFGLTHEQAEAIADQTNTPAEFCALLAGGGAWELA